MGKHYIRIDAQKRIIKGLTNDLTAYPDGILGTDIYTHEGGRIFEMHVDGEWLTNPPLTDENGALMYAWNGKTVQKRSDNELAEEIENFVPPINPPSQIDMLEHRVDGNEDAIIELAIMISEKLENSPIEIGIARVSSTRKMLGALGVSAIFARRVSSGSMTIDDVPLIWRDRVLGAQKEIRTVIV